MNDATSPTSVGEVLLLNLLAPKSCTKGAPRCLETRGKFTSEAAKLPNSQKFF